MPMSNIGTLKRTEPIRVPDAAAIASVASVWTAAFILTIAIVSFRPFQPAGFDASGAQAEGGDIVNQLGFGMLGIAALGGMLCFAQPRRLAALFSPWWLLMIAFLGISVMIAPNPDIVVRSMAFTIIGMLAMAAVIAMPRDADGLSTTFATMSIVVLVLCYFGVVFLSSVAVHSANSVEPQHAGFWRGSFSHKNVAGPVMAFLSFIGFYLYRRGWRGIGGFVFVAAMLFLVQTGSKTTAALVPAAIIVVAAPSLVGMRRLTVLLFLLAIAVTGVATLGIEMIAPLKAYMSENYPDFTYTGRTSLWAFLIEAIEQAPWVGYGFESFWGSPVVLDTIPPFDRDWDIRFIVNGHNGYLDVAATMGLPAMATAIMALLVVPLRDYMNVPRKRENVFLADLFMMILFFGALNAFLETFFFSRAEPVWLLFFLAAFGMRYAARFPLSSKLDN